LVDDLYNDINILIGFESGTKSKQNEPPKKYGFVIRNP